ncbi:protein of unknown function [Pseudodesulfovibrio profundus]|uniref:Uncharacterized protein n=1 Tax=Pseudodesulfovibrio profundus TaxID=57320 RepID=A0A2C8F3L7_9BACT|nr:protein of unknown function [Pseudodesulfovibrio profundus]
MRIFLHMHMQLYSLNLTKTVWIVFEKMANELKYKDKPVLA